MPHWRATTAPRKPCLSLQTTSSGIADRVVKAVDFLDAIDTGAFTVRKTAITSQISKLTDEIGRKEDIASQYEERLRLQFASLDALLQKLKGQTSALQALQPDKVTMIATAANAYQQTQVMTASRCNSSCCSTILRFNRWSRPGSHSRTTTKIRARFLDRSMAIVGELSSVLDFEQGGRSPIPAPAV